MQPQAQCPDYLVIGHITTDIVSDHNRVLGGTATYAATTAKKMGLFPGVFTAIAQLPLGVEESFAIAQTPSQTTSTFEHKYINGRRKQVVHAVASPLNLGFLPEHWKDVPIVHLGPVLNECTLEMATAFPKALIGATAQGWTRSCKDPLPAPMVIQEWCPEKDLLKKLDLLVLSEDDVSGDKSIVSTYAKECDLVVLTQGDQGLILYVAGKPHVIPAHAAKEVDANGAGDVFASAMLIRLYETRDPFEAAHFAAIAAAISVQGSNHTNIPTREEVQKHIKKK